MGNTNSSSGRGHHDDSVDFGSLTPQGVYTGPRDWNQAIVSQYICARKLAPFYRPLEEYDESWTDDQILAARKELPEGESAEPITRIEAPLSSNGNRSAHRRPGSLKEPSRPEAAVYRGAVECPICFLYYPPNINHSRCCDQAICTECFVQIKRNEPTTTHLVSEPAACPYCVQDNFGIVYTPPLWRAGIGGDGTSFQWVESARGSQIVEGSSPYPTHKRRQKSFGADSPDVVTTDQIRPDWEAKLAAVRAAVARRANRRIIMRQVGDRLIPVGVTSGRVHALTPEEAAAEATDNGGGSRRSRRRQANNNPNFEQYVGMAGQDLEELMMMEAMRLSLLDHEEHQRKEAEEKKKKAAQAEAEAPTSDVQASSSVGTSTSSSVPTSSTALPLPIPEASGSSGQERLAPSASASFTRSRTPPPPGTEGTSDHTPSSSWRRRTSSPPPFSTLRAALSTTATASAFLTPSAHTNEQGSAQPIPSISDNSAQASHTIPTIKVGPGVSNSDGVDGGPSSMQSLPAAATCHTGPLEGSSAFIGSSMIEGSPSRVISSATSEEALAAELIGAMEDVPRDSAR